MGDLFLYESGVFDKVQYIKEFNQYLKRHFGNGGRLNLSVADSSFDTWLDGYDMGIPDRKSSIYIEGALISFMLNTKIKQASNNQKSLHTVMKVLYEEFALKQLGYTENDYKNILEQVGGINLDEFFNKYIWGTQPFEDELKECLAYLGFKFIKKESTLSSEQYGLKIIPQEKEVKVIHVQENSAAYKVGLRRGDIISVINNYPLNNDFDKWLGYFKEDKITLKVIQSGMIKELFLPKINVNQFYDFIIE